MRKDRSSMSAANIIADARLRAGLTQRELAKRAGTSCSAIANYESGKVDPAYGTLERIVAACGMELRTEAAELTENDVNQYACDASISLDKAMRRGEQALKNVLAVIG